MGWARSPSKSPTRSGAASASVFHLETVTGPVAVTSTWTLSCDGSVRSHSEAADVIETARSRRQSQHVVLVGERREYIDGLVMRRVPVPADLRATFVLANGLMPSQAHISPRTPHARAGALKNRSGPGHRVVHQWRGEALGLFVTEDDRGCCGDVENHR